MGDYWDYRLKKADMAWQLALRVIPKEVASGGQWTEASFINNAQEILKEAFEAIDAVFTADKEHSN